MAEKKYYWLKLKRDFFKRHDIQIIEGMPNGKDYVLFYLKLLLESIDHEGELRFSDTIPYSESMLSTITNTNIDIVRSAMKILTELQMVEVLDDSTIYMTEIEKMLGSETKWAEKKRLYRERQKLIEGQCPPSVPSMSDKSKSKSKSKSIDIDTISPTLSGESVSIEDVFDKTYAIYPRKEGKTKGRQAYVSYLKKGRNVGGKRVRLNHQQIYFAVQAYAANVEGKDKQYIQHFDTFMNSTVVDCVEQTKPDYEAFMKERYGEDWKNIKFVYEG